MRDTGSIRHDAKLLAAAAPGWIVRELLRHADVAVGAGRGKLEHARNVATPVDRIAENAIVHVRALGGEAGVFDVPDDFHLVHAVPRAGLADDVFLDHHAA